MTEHGRWRFLPALVGGRWEGDRWHHGSWTGGFVAGQLWQASMFSEEAEALRTEAWAICQLLERRAVDPSTHDLGFLFWPSAVLGFEATGDSELRVTALRAAETLLARRHPAGFLQSWGDLTDSRARGWSAIDTMVNLPLLWWAGDAIPEAPKTARSHAELTAATYFRDDGTTYHIVRFDDNGTPTFRGTFQGFAEASTWSRGQAWAVRGFADGFIATGEGWMLEMASRAADAFLSRLPPDKVPPWDFDDPLGPRSPRDASAAAIVASTALRLGWGDSPAARGWRELGERLLQGLIASAMDETTRAGLLQRSSYSVPYGEGVEGATTWGDYFFLEALVQATAPDRCLHAVSPVEPPGGRVIGHHGGRPPRSGEQTDDSEP